MRFGYIQKQGVLQNTESAIFCTLQYLKKHILKLLQTNWPMKMMIYIVEQFILTCERNFGHVHIPMLI